MSETPPPLLIADLGLVEYERAWQLQKAIAASRRAGAIRYDVLMLLEHPHVFTMGARGRQENLLDCTADDGQPIEVHHVNRGGDITYHGPGQLVGYPIVDIAAVAVVGGDVIKWLRELECALIDVCRRLDVPARPNPPYTGVWVEDRKIASMGVGVRNGVSMHGFALNVDPQMHYFNRIVPCGIHGVKMTSLSAELGMAPPLEHVKALLAQTLADRLGLAPAPAEEYGLQALMQRKGAP